MELLLVLDPLLLDFKLPCLMRNARELEACGTSGLVDEICSDDSPSLVLASMISEMLGIVGTLAKCAPNAEFHMGFSTQVLFGGGHNFPFGNDSVRCCKVVCNPPLHDARYRHHLRFDQQEMTSSLYWIGLVSLLVLINR